LRGKAIATERLHVTLHHVEDFAGLPEGIVAKTCAVASASPLCQRASHSAKTQAEWT
jgi:hypothetical protein